MEINMAYSDALTMADRHVLFKGAVREMAALQGVQVSFMPKWDEAHAGNGCHIHMSMWRGEENAFADGAGNVSVTMRHFLGGVMALTRDLQYFYAPTINSYKRFGKYGFSPSNVTWGVNNRTAAYRLCGHGKSSRIENRIPGADINPHLMYAAMIGAGLYGIVHEIEPIGPAMQTNAYADAPDAPRLHETMIGAVDALAGSGPAREILGEAVVNHYVQVARWEIKEFMTSVTDWERARYFELG
jgi:glutamine synthetase